MVRVHSFFILYCASNCLLFIKGLLSEYTLLGPQYENNSTQDIRSRHSQR